MNMFDLTGRIALVTGSTRGIGLAISRALGHAGATVVLNGRGEAKLTEVQGKLAAEGLAVRGISFDVTDASAVEAAVARVEAEIGPIRILVNNAGIQHRAPLEDFPIAEWDRLMRTNIDSIFYVGQAVAKRMIDRRPHRADGRRAHRTVRHRAGDFF